jgi:hypothetical protein
MPAKGYQNKPGRQSTSQASTGVKVRNSIAYHFAHLNAGPHDKQYLTRLANEHPASYVALVSKVIPQQAQIEIQHNAVDLGAAMLEATQRLAAFNEALTIDHQPVVPVPDVQPARVPDASLKIGKGEGGGGYPEDRGAAVDCGPDPDTLK